MSKSTRGADLLAQTLAASGHTTVFTLSGNHIMPIYDAAVGTDIDLIHVRHEAAAVHMADAFGRLTGEAGIALVASGQGHTNAVAALTTALGADAPLVLLSGHAGLEELGRGAFQEMPQADLARPVTKASWTVQSADRLGADLAKAIRIAKSGRPGPVHLSLPVDLLEAKMTNLAVPARDAFARETRPFPGATAASLLAHLRAAKRPLILAGPMLCTPPGRDLLAQLQHATGVPAVGMESPRGINDPMLGAFAEVLAQADLVMLLGKPHDYTLKFAEPPAVSASAQFVVVDPESELIARAVREKGERVVAVAIADADATAHAMIAAAGSGGRSDTGWLQAVVEAVSYRPAAWAVLEGGAAGVHPAAMGRELQKIFDRHTDGVLVVDGGEVGQWGQACVSARRRVINGVAGSIGAGLPFAIAARTVERKAPVVAIMGDGTFGFHMAEFDTAVRHELPFVAVVGNDGRWNAEHQIQLRQYGPERAHSCTLLPTRYDQVAAAMGGHGELVTEFAQMGPAVERALASNKPACINVMIEGVPAPTVRRG